MWLGNGRYAYFARLLLEKLASTHLADHHGNTPLHLAAIHGQTELLGVLIQHGADITATNKRGNTPLCEAAAHGQTAAALFLLEKQRRTMEIPGNHPRLARQIAEQYGFQETADTLALAEDRTSSWTSIVGQSTKTFIVSKERK